MTNMVNDVWVGDHCPLDLFVIDQEGRTVRPWLSAWLDAGSGYLVGWIISAEPNSHTLIQAFAQAAAFKVGNPVQGLPRMIYVDNCMHYYSEALEDGTLHTRSLGPINSIIGIEPLYHITQVRVYYGQAYQGRMKLIEKCFRTLREKCRQKLPGCCGESPASQEELAEIVRAVQAMNLRGELLTIDELAKRFKCEVLPEYHHNPQGGDRELTPAELHGLLPKARGDAPDAETLINPIHKVQTASIHSNDSSQSAPRPEPNPGEQQRRAQPGKIYIEIEPNHYVAMTASEATAWIQKENLP